MRILNLKLRNCGLHESVELNCDSPIVGVCGVNGSGKSTVLEMLRYALTGETDENIDTYVKHGAGNGSVEVTFRKNGQTHTILRQFGKSPKRKLTSEAGPELTKVKDIDTFLADLLGADRLAMNSAIFIGQGKLEELLFRGDADRRSLFIKLVNLGFCTSRAEAAAALLGEVGKQVANLEPVLISTEELLKTRETELALARTAQSSLRDWTVELAELSERQRLSGQRDELNRQIGQANLQVQIRQAQLLERYPEAAWEGFYETFKQDQENRTQQRQQKGTELQLRVRVVGESRRYQELVAEQRQLGVLMAQEKSDLGALPEASALQTELATVNHQLGELRTLRADKARLAQVLADLPIARSTLDERSTHEAVAAETVAAGTENLRLVRELVRLAKERMDFGQELRRCFGDVGMVDKATCPKCSLTVTGFEVPAEAKVSELVSYFQKVSAQARDAVARLSGAEAAHLALLRLEAKDRQVVVAMEAEQTTLEQKLAGRQVDEQAEPDLQERLRKLTEQQRQRTQLETVSAQHLERCRTVMLEQMKLKEWRNHPTLLDPDVPARLATELRQLDETIKVEGSKLQDLTAHLSALQNTRESLVRMGEELSSVDVRLAGELSPDLASMLSDTGSMSAVKSLVDEGQVRWQAAAAVTANAVAAHQALVEQVNDLRRRMDEDKIRREVMRDLVLLKELFSDGGLPSIVVGHYFQKLAAVTRRHLQSLNANFRIEIEQAKPLTFCFERTDRPEGLLPMGKLSGGQKVRLCLAFLMAVQEVLVPDVGLLVLDEVSDSLDVEGVESLAELLRGMAGRLQNTDHQLWVVDHRQEIASALPVKLELLAP